MGFGIKVPSLSSIGNAWKNNIAPISTTLGATFAGGPMAGAAVGNMWSQRGANSENRQLAKDQMSFQHLMSGTAHQREVEDLKKAGLNPILSAGGNGSSTPSGASANMVAPQINMPDFMAYGISLKQLEQADQRLAIDKAESAARIKKNMTDSEFTELKKILAGKGMVRAELEGEAAQVLRKSLKFIKESVMNPKMPKRDTRPIKTMDDLKNSNLFMP